MTSIKRTFTLAILAIVAVCSAMPAAAQFKFGLKAGVAISNIKFSNGNELWNSITDENNRAGFVGGAMVEFTVPVVGVGLDASALYVHRNVGTEKTDALKRDYIDIPVNLKYKLNIPAIGAFVKPFVTTGPSFAFLVSKKDEVEINGTPVVKNKSVDIAWNFGFGVELLSHVQIAASYGLGLTNTLENLHVVNNKESIEGKNRYWTVTAAYLF